MPVPSLSFVTIVAWIRTSIGAGLVWTTSTVAAAAISAPVRGAGVGRDVTRWGPWSAYGAAGSLVVVLIWVFYSSQIIFFGAEFTQVYARQFGKDANTGSTTADPHKA